MDPRLKDSAKTALGALGLSGQDVRVTREWLRTRQAAIRNRAGVRRGRAIVWTRPGRTELWPVDVPLAGPGQVTIEVSHSFVSPGTERAWLLRLPGAQVEYPFRPGYSVAGTIIAVGRGVTGFAIGDTAAVGGVPHQSLATVDAEVAFRVEPGIDPAQAAMIELATIAGQGVRAGRPEPGEAVVIFGAGLIGALALRLCRLHDVGDTTVVAGSESKRSLAESGGATRFIVAGEETLESPAPLVIEATSDPSVALDAVRAAADGGRVVLLGSPRGSGVGRGLVDLARRRIRLIGAHVRNLATDSDRTGHDVRRELGEQFLGALADGRLAAADLVGELVDPADAALLYRRLADDRRLVGAVFDWSKLAASSRSRSVPLGAPPIIRQGGDEYTGAPARRASPPPPVSIPQSATVRFGIVGCGEISLQNARAIGEAPNTALGASFDTNPGLAADLAQRYGGDAEPTLGDLVARSDVDVVLVSVPHHLHRPVSLAAIEAGKHVVVEKPLANDLGEGRAIIEAAAEAGVRLSVCFPHRYDHRVAAAKELIDLGAIGPLVGATVTFYQDKPPSYWLGGYSGRSTSTWRSSKERSGGGVLIMNATHYLDLLRHLVGDEVVEVAAMIGDEPGREVEDIVSGTLRFGGGGLASLTASSSVSGARYDELRLWGRDGHIEVFPTPRVFPLRAVADLAPGRWQALGVEDPGSYRTAYFADLAASISADQAPFVGPVDAFANQAIVDAIYESAETGSVIIPERLESAPR